MSSQQYEEQECAYFRVKLCFMVHESGELRAFLVFTYRLPRCVCNANCNADHAVRLLQAFVRFHPVMPALGCDTAKYLCSWTTSDQHDYTRYTYVQSA